MAKEITKEESKKPHATSLTVGGKVIPVFQVGTDKQGKPILRADMSLAFDKSDPDGQVKALRAENAKLRDQLVEQGEAISDLQKSVEAMSARR